MHSNCYYELVFLLIARIYFFLRAMAHECILCTSRKKEGVFRVYVSQILCHMHVGTSLLCKCEHMLLEKGFFFLQYIYIYILPPLLMSQGFQRCDDFDITCVWCSFCKCFFFCLHPL